ncbi:hypothetical protein PINS_up018178 [Pythium insidiosum]|nr:hypothetical protein PINS_up018178 [Pythium insidiosum]
MTQTTDPLSVTEMKPSSAPLTPHAKTHKSGYSHLSSPSVAGVPPLPRRLGHVHVVTMQERVQRLMDGRIGITLEMINVLLSVVLVVIAIVKTYEANTNLTDPSYSAFELGCTALFTIDLILRVFAAEDRMKVLTSPMGIIDIITIVPTYLALFLASLSGFHSPASACASNFPHARSAASLSRRGLVPGIRLRGTMSLSLADGSFFL